jgi:glycerol-3-phosphate acyltransferase PlsY
MTVSDHWTWILVCPILAYFIGAIPFSFLMAKWRSGIDIRQSGNKNVGGLNVMMRSGYIWGFLSGMLDFLKGLICLLIVLYVPFDDTALAGAGKYYEITQHQLIYMLVAIAVILGHNFPVYLKFHGGRGVAAISGFLLLTNPLLFTAFILVTGLVTVFTGYIRPAQVVAMFVGVPIAFFLNFFPPWIVNQGLSSTFFLGMFTLGISLAILPKYIKPIIDAFKGTEYQMGRKGVDFKEEESADTNN